MNIIFRTDSSIDIGSGHLMRCLTLADELKKSGAKVEFVCRELEGNLIKIVEEKGYLVHRLPKPILDEEGLSGYARWLGVNGEIDAEQTEKILKSTNKIDLLIIDHYALDIKWESKLRSYTKKIMVIDDLANRKHDADILLDQNYVENMATRYDNLVPPSCIKLLGPKYVLLRPEFYAVKGNLRKRDNIVKRILIFFGGSDPTNETTKAIKAVQGLNRPDIEVDIVIGASNPWQEEIKQQCEELGFNYYRQVNNMAELMAKADLAIGAGGATTWERCFLGLPSICIIAAENQEEIINFLDQENLLINLGWNNKVKIEDVTKTIETILNNSGKIQEQINKNLAIFNHQNMSKDLLKIIKVEKYEDKAIEIKR